MAKITRVKDEKCNKYCEQPILQAFGREKPSYLMTAEHTIPHQWLLAPISSIRFSAVFKGGFGFYYDILSWILRNSSVCCPEGVVRNPPGQGRLSVVRAAPEKTRTALKMSS
ncbi:hypothetical protein, unlikely [Trypanosoma congolense IL3000]|uniref:Uncharacterized protein n=1 Tax=Trypanosoma congolense (strain IL3000) TaxID=1068625 RepID=F9WG03_TRYCI|nr:hypothetical protein, unlikely [Trypanosoma congolense IL3000]